MIETFEEFTYKLTEEEKAIVPIVVKALEKKVGKANIVTNAQMCAGLWKVKQIKMTMPRLRKIIYFIRNEFLIEGLVGTGSGYYVSKDPAEIEKHIKSLDQREAHIRNTKQKMQIYLMKLLNNGQH